MIGRSAVVFSAIVASCVVASPTQFQKESSMAYTPSLYNQPELMEALSRHYESQGRAQPRNLDGIGGGNLLRNPQRSFDGELPGSNKRYIQRKSEEFIYPPDFLRGNRENLNDLEYPNYYNGIKRNFDEIDRSGYPAFSKKNFDEIDRSGIPTFMKKNFDEIDRSGFPSFVKKNFDEIDRSGFPSFTKKNFDEIDRSGYPGFKKRSVQQEKGKTTSR